jgi:hypothetical protein
MVQAIGELGQKIPAALTYQYSLEAPAGYSPGACPNCQELHCTRHPKALRQSSEPFTGNAVTIIPSTPTFLRRQSISRSLSGREKQDYLIEEAQVMLRLPLGIN